MANVITGAKAMVKMADSAGVMRTVGYATGHCWYHNLRDTTATYKYTMGDSVNHHSGSYEVSYQSACLHTTTAPVNYIRYFSGDNLTGGKFSLYGITGGL